MRISFKFLLVVFFETLHLTAAAEWSTTLWTGGIAFFTTLHQMAKKTQTSRCPNGLIRTNADDILNKHCELAWECLGWWSLKSIFFGGAVMSAIVVGTSAWKYYNTSTQWCSVSTSKEMN